MQFPLQYVKNRSGKNYRKCRSQGLQSTDHERSTGACRNRDGGLGEFSSIYLYVRIRIHANKYLTRIRHASPLEYIASREREREPEMSGGDIFSCNN